MKSQWYLLPLAGFLFAPSLATAQEKSKRPNVVFIFSDDQRADTIAALGNKHIKTPNLDKLVARGTAFRRTYCMGAMQGAVCVPSRSMMLSGRTLFRINDNLKGITTWPEMFSRAGYRTFVTGKWHNQQASVLAAFNSGKNIFFGGMGDPYALPVSDITEKRTLTEKRLSGKHSCELFADSMVDFIKAQKGAKQPFVAYASLNGPHDPRVAPKEFHDLYDKNKLPLPANFLPVHPFNNGEMIVRDEKLAPWPRTRDVVRQHLADYYAYITFVDAQVGRVMQALRDAGLEDDTIIVFASDHGLAIGSHGLFGKQNLYDHSMRAPLIMAGPGIPKGQQNDALAYLFDIFPTLGDLAHIKGPAGSEGKSLVPVMKGEAKLVRDSIFLAYRQFQRSVRDDRWKIIVYPQINKTQLFDLESDPDEMKDLAKDPAHAKTVARLTERLVALQKDLGDTQALRSAKPQPEKFEIPNVNPMKKKKKQGGEANRDPNLYTENHVSAFRLPSFYCSQPTGQAAKMAYLDNGAIKIGVNLTLGGAITYLSPSRQDKNLVNNFDFGRQIQMSYYSGPAPYVVGEKEPAKHWQHLGWNPIQAGDDFKNRAKVIDTSNDGKTIHVKCIPMQWPLDNEPAECSFESWIRLEGNTARVKCRLTNQRGDTTQYAARTQELPAVYTNAPYHRLMTYTGNKPFTDDTLSQIVLAKDQKGPWSHWLATENWAAHVNDDDWGLGVWHPGVFKFTGGFTGNPGRGGPSDVAAGYIAPHRQEILDHNIVHEYEYVLIIGKLAEIRAHVVKHARPISPPVYRFDKDRQGWHYINASDAGWPIRDGLKVLLDKDDPQMHSAATFFAAEAAGKMRIEAAFHTKEKIAQIYWATLDQPDFKEANSLRFPIQGDGKLRTYEVNLASAKTYRGSIVGLRFDPIPVGNPGDHVLVRSIRMERE